MFRPLTIPFLIALAVPAFGQAPAPPAAAAPNAAPRPQRPPNPTRDPHTEGYVTATELPDGNIPSPKTDGNFIIGPTHPVAPEMNVVEDVPKGTIYTFEMKSVDSKFYPGVVRDTPPPPAPGAPAPAFVPGARRNISNHPGPNTRTVSVYVPKQYVPGTIAPFILGTDGDTRPFKALDNLIAQKRVPVMIVISVGTDHSDGPGSERGLEYDTMSGKYAEFIEAEVLPLVEKQYNVKLTRDPDARASYGGSSGGAAALAMAWFHPDLYHRVLSFSGTFVNNQFPVDAELPHGGWELHEHLIPNSPVKPLRIWIEVGDKDNGGTGDMMHDWVWANENTAKVLAAKGYHYQFVFGRNTGHTDRATIQQTLPEALEYVWQNFHEPKK